jgi:DNA-binding MarR family transcriptional regulator
MNVTEIADRIASECLMSRWRMMNRRLTSIYDEELRRFDLKSSQLGLLVALAKAGPIRRIQLGRYFALDPSTLTRNLRVMLKQGWIKEVPDDSDRRGQPLELTAKGRRLLESVGPAWQRAQDRAGKMLGADGAALLLAVSQRQRAGAEP